MIMTMLSEPPALGANPQENADPIQQALKTITKPPENISRGQVSAAYRMLQQHSDRLSAPQQEQLIRTLATKLHELPVGQRDNANRLAVIKTLIVKNPKLADLQLATTTASAATQPEQNISSPPKTLLEILTEKLLTQHRLFNGNSASFLDTLETALQSPKVNTAPAHALLDIATPKTPGYAKVHRALKQASIKRDELQVASANISSRLSQAHPPLKPTENPRHLTAAEVENFANKVLARMQTDMADGHFDLHAAAKSPNAVTAAIELLSDFPTALSAERLQHPVNIVTAALALGQPVAADKLTHLTHVLAEACGSTGKIPKSTQNEYMGFLENIVFFRPEQAATLSQVIAKAPYMHKERRATLQAIATANSSPELNASTSQPATTPVKGRFMVQCYRMAAYGAGADMHSAPRAYSMIVINPKVTSGQYGGVHGLWVQANFLTGQHKEPEQIFVPQLTLPQWRNAIRQAAGELTHQHHDPYAAPVILDLRPKQTKPPSLQAKGKSNIPKP
jgi:hypothetical protein